MWAALAGSASKALLIIIRTGSLLKEDTDALLKEDGGILLWEDYSLT